MKNTYDTLKEVHVKIPLQLMQQHFHLYKPQKYTHPKGHWAYLFTLAIKRNLQTQGDWGKRILKDVLRASQTKSYQKTGYVGNGAILTHITYEALGM